MPTVAAWRAEDERPSSLETRTVDSTVPYGVTWIGITHQGAWEAAGKNWDSYMPKAVGTGPWKLEAFAIRERAVLARNPDYWDAARIPKGRASWCCCRCRRPNTRVAALRSGQVDFIEAPPPDAVAVA